MACTGGNAKYAEVTGKKADVGLLWTYTGTFSDIAKGKAATEAMLAQGAGLVTTLPGRWASVTLRPSLSILKPKANLPDHPS